MTEKRKNRLTKLKIKEVSGVDSPANPGAHVAFWKRDSNQPNGENSMDVKELAEKLEKMEAANATLEVLAKMSDAEKSYMETLSEDAKKGFMDLTSEQRQGEMKKVEDAQKKADELKKAEEEKLGKDTADAIAKSEARAADAIAKADALEAKIAKLEADKDFSDFAKSAQDRVPSLKAEDKQDFLKSLHGMEAAQREPILKELEEAEKVKAAFAMEKGHSTRSADDPEAKLDALAKKYAEENKVDFVKAYSEVCKTEEGKKLYEQRLPN